MNPQWTAENRGRDNRKLPLGMVRGTDYLNTRSESCLVGLHTYSSRRAIIGWTLAARRAGM